VFSEYGFGVAHFQRNPENINFCITLPHCHEISKWYCNLSSTDPTDQRAEAPRVPRDGTGGVLPLKFQDFSGHLGETSNISWFISMFQIEGVIKKKTIC